MVRREHLRLRKVFRQLLLLSVAAQGAVQACSSSSSSGTPSGPGPDASVPPDAGGQSDQYVADVGTDAAVPVDAAPASCEASAPYFGDSSCYYYVDLPCGTTAPHSTAPDAACNLPLLNCNDWCPIGPVAECLYNTGQGCDEYNNVTVEAGQPATIACGTCAGTGRRPAGLSGRRKAAKTPRDGLRAHFEDAAYLEAASVFAFERLRDELAAFGAPAELVKVAERSAREEERHARVTARLARAYGGRPEPARVTRARPRSLEAMARENAVEGCVRETFGAMVATWQAANATDARVRRSMKRIARDETRHAALAWAVARWAESRLDRKARTRVARARAAAHRELLRDLGAELPDRERLEAGLPSARESRAIAAKLYCGQQAALPIGG
jgi:rubrerythrin